MKKTVLLLLALFVCMTSASAASVSSSVSDVQTSSTYSAPGGYEPKGYVGNIISQIFDPVGQILSNYVIAFRNIFDTDNTVPVWNATTKVFDVGTITDTGTNVGIGVSSPGEKLSVNGRLSITGNPNSDDDVGDRGYNDARYIVIGTSGDQIQNGTIDSSEIENNTLTSSDLSADSVGNSELINSQVFSIAGLNLNGKAKIVQGPSYDLWIQGAATDTGGSARNLAFLGQKSNDQLRINYNGEYTGGTRFDGNIGIGTNLPTTLFQIGEAMKLGGGGLNGNSELGADIHFTSYGLTTSESSMEFIIDSDNDGTNASFRISKNAATNNSGGPELMRVEESGNVGIGTTSPNYPLDVNGKIRMQGGTSASDGNNIVATKGYVDSKSGVPGLIINEYLSSGGSRSELSAGNYNKALLNNVERNEIGASLNTTNNRFTLPQGSYYCSYYSPVNISKSDNVGNIHTRLYNVTKSNAAIIGQSLRGGDWQSLNLMGEGIINITNANETFELQVYSSESSVHVRDAQGTGVNKFFSSVKCFSL